MNPVTVYVFFRNMFRPNSISLWIGLWGFVLFCVLTLSHSANTAYSPAPEFKVQNTCTLDGITPVEITDPHADSTEWHGRFDMPDMPFLWDTSVSDETIGQFREAVCKKLDTDPDAHMLIARQRGIFAGMSAEWSGEAANSDLLLQGRAGKITPINCLEIMLWKWQNERFPMLEHPTEFGAFVLLGNDEVRVYLSSADLVGLRIRGAVTKSIEADIEAGYRLLTHIHNHPFLFDREIGDRMWTVEGTLNDVAGALAPSMTDVQFYRVIHDKYGLEEAWITNGIQSSRFRADEFDVLSGR